MAMTRQQRIAAGWAECWIVRDRNGFYASGNRKFSGDLWKNERNEGFRFTSYGDAASWITQLMATPKRRGR